MDVMRHAAFCVRVQHMVWQQVFMKLKDTFLAAPCQREGPTKIRCTAFKKVINGNLELLGELLGLRGCRGRSDQRSCLYRVELGPAFIEIGFALLGDLILVGTSAVAVLVVQHLYYLHPLSIDVAERCK